MKCILMNKNREIAKIEYETNYNIISNIDEIYNIEYGPIMLKNAIENKSKNPSKELTNWLRGRCIPEWRKDIEKLLQNLEISSPEELLNKSYALSLSDQYWIKEEKQKNLKWENINFFTNEFKYKGYFQVAVSGIEPSEEISLKSPNNTTDGMLPKAWVIEEGERILVKGTFFSSRQEPTNEWLVSQICKRLKLNYCNYEVAVENNKIVSKCKNFINENEEIITAYEIFQSKMQDNNTNDIEHYIKILEENGIKNARQQVEDMFLIDYIVMNIDRHMKNFGIIRNVETLEWEKTTLIFDTGECMECDKLLNEMNFKNGKCKFFKNTNKDISELLKYIDISRYDFEVLKDMPEEYKNKLLKYKSYTDMSEERIQKLYEGLKYRIGKLIGGNNAL